MNILRRIGLGFMVLVVSLSLSVIALLASIFFIMHSPEPLKQALASSGVYDELVSNILTQTGPVSRLPLNDPGVARALREAMPAAFVRNSSEQIIGSMYDWIQGATVTPAFSVDLTDVKARFANNIAMYVEQKVGALRECNQAVVRPTTTGEVLALTCLPGGITSAQLAETVRTEALASELVTSDRLDASILRNGQGQPINEFAFMPQAYQYYMLALYVMPLLILLCSAAVIFLSVTKRAGFKRLAWLLISGGLTAMVIAAVSIWLLKAMLLLFGDSSVLPAFEDKIFSIIEPLASTQRAWWFGIGAAYALTGITILIILKCNPPKLSLTMGDSRHREDIPSPVRQAPPTDNATRQS